MAKAPSHPPPGPGPFPVHRIEDSPTLALYQGGGAGSSGTGCDVAERGVGATRWTCIPTTS